MEESKLGERTEMYRKLNNQYEKKTEKAREREGERGRDREERPRPRGIM